MSYTDKEFLTGKEFRELLSISSSTMCRWIRTGRIKAIKLSPAKNSEVRIPSSEVTKLLNECTAETQAGKSED